ncbi:MAG TPA: ubiquitin-like domain-containing protein [Aggregatilineales bacterium]|nr:ubiquitin-like domain-containing protein [Aggregatilineales bacterium]
MNASPSPQRFESFPPRGGLWRHTSSVSPLVLLLGLVFFFGTIIVTGLYLLTAKAVIVVINGASHEARTHESTVGRVLNEIGYPVQSADRVSPATDTPIQSGLTITLDQGVGVAIAVDGQIVRVRTRLTDPRAILAEANISLGDHDSITVDGHDLADSSAAPAMTHAAAPPVAPRLIQIQRAITVKIAADGQVMTLQTPHRTVGEALRDAGLTLFLADDITPHPDASLADGDTITVRGSISVTIKVDGYVLNTRTHGQTVEAVLGEAGIALVGMDTSSPASDAPITPGMTIQVTRVTEDDQIDQEAIDFNTIVQPDPTLPLDSRQVIQTGIKGIRETRYRLRREDGAVVSQSAPETVVVQEPRDEIVAVGTLAQLQTLNTPEGGIIQYWRMIPMLAHSYRPSSTGRAPDDPNYGVTATGAKLQQGIAAVDPAVIPLGTKLYIPGYGLATAADTGGAVNGLLIDLGYSDADYQDWNRPVEVYVLAPIPDHIPLLPTTEPTPDASGALR